MFKWLKLVFHVHIWEIIKESSNTLKYLKHSQLNTTHYFEYVSKCNVCGKLKTFTTKIRK